MRLEGLIYVPQAGVVEVSAGVDVVLQVLVGVVHPIVDHGDVYAFTHDAVRQTGSTLMSLLLELFRCHWHAYRESEIRGLRKERVLASHSSMKSAYSVSSTAWM